MITLKLKNYTPYQVHYLFHKICDIQQHTDCEIQHNFNEIECNSCEISEVCRDLENLILFLGNEIKENYPHCKNK